MNADSAVMAHFPAPLTRVESDAVADRIEQHFADHGFGLWAAEIPGRCEFAGFVGLSRVELQNHLFGAIEVAWRFAREHWGLGLATEGARMSVRFGFDELLVHEIVSFTSEGNERSRALMERIGMTRDPGADFDHPALPPGHVLRRHVLYRLTKAWSCSTG